MNPNVFHSFLYILDNLFILLLSFPAKASYNLKETPETEEKKKKKNGKNRYRQYMQRHCAYYSRHSGAEHSDRLRGRAKRQQDS